MTLHEVLEPLAKLDYRLAKAAVDAGINYPAVNAVAVFCAQYLIGFFPLTLIYLWMNPEKAGKHHGAQKAVIIAVFAVVFSLAVKSGIEFFYLRDRPFVAHLDIIAAITRIDRSSSFPSAHTLSAFAIASSIWLSGYHRLGKVMLGLAALVGLGRIFVGVHYPLDVLAGAIIACFVSWLLHRESSSLKRFLPNH